MKKLLLFAAMAAVALGASAGYTIEKLWSYDISSINASNARQGLGMNGKFYINERTESTIYIYDQTGLIGTMTGSPNMTITRDEAGNIIYANTAFPGDWKNNPTITVVNPETLESKVYTIPEECDPLSLGRCDVLGTAKGNMMEDGELYIATVTNTSTIVKLVITDGEVNTDDSYAPEASPITTSTTTPIYPYTDLEGNDALLYYTRTTNPVKLLPDGDNYSGSAFMLPRRGTTMGMFPFVWDGKELFLYNTQAAANYLDGFAVAEAYKTAATITTPLVEVEPTVSASLSGTLAINWLWAEVDGDGVTIYQYYPSTNDTPGAHISVYRMTKTPEYTVAGNILNNWEINPANNMTLGENGTYTLTLEGMEIPANYLIEYKVTSDGTWWPQDFNAEYLINEAGIYTLVFTFDPETGNVSLVATKTGNISYNGDVYILGEVNDNGGWFTNKGVQMTRDEENNVYTATITTTGEAYTDPETGIGYSYFSFTKQLAETADDWDAIDPYRFGADSDGDFLVTDETLGNEIALMNGGATFQIPAGQWNLALSVDNMTLIIEKVVPAGKRGDVDNNNIVDINDVTRLIDVVLGKDVEYHFNNSDCNVEGGNGNVDINDVTALINFVLTGAW
ncbi:MAG: hypothetical protein IKI10_02340 [Muribaculaceae bacterium]|nr:hypothetical protein [Muribaculaceae bacterium]